MLFQKFGSKKSMDVDFGKVGIEDETFGTLSLQVCITLAVIE